jgi:hypothetical protein
MRHNLRDVLLVAVKPTAPGLPLSFPACAMAFLLSTSMTPPQVEL